MPSANFIWRNWKKQQTVFLNNLSLLKKEPGTDNIHDWRVATKKLRSYRTLSDEISGKKHDEKEWKAIEKLFNVLGRYRDLQMNLKLLTKTEEEEKTKFTSLKKNLRSAMPDARKRMKNALLDYQAADLLTISRQFNKEIGVMETLALIEQIKKICTSRVEKICEFIKDFRSQAHEARKELKNIYYWLSICPPKSILSRVKLKALSKILDQLGDWHDHRVLYSRIRSFRKQYLPGGTGEHDDYKKTEKKLKKASHNTIDSIGKDIHQWIDGSDNAFATSNRGNKTA